MTRPCQNNEGQIKQVDEEERERGKGGEAREGGCHFD